MDLVEDLNFTFVLAYVIHRLLVLLNNNIIIIIFLNAWKNNDGKFKAWRGRNN